MDPAGFHGVSGGGADLGNDIAVVHLDETAPVAPVRTAPDGRAPVVAEPQGPDVHRESDTAAPALTRTKGPHNIETNFDPDVRNIAVEPYRSLQQAWLTTAGNESIGAGGTCFGDFGRPALPRRLERHGGDHDDRRRGLPLERPELPARHPLRPAVPRPRRQCPFRDATRRHRPMPIPVPPSRQAS